MLLWYELLFVFLVLLILLGEGLLRNGLANEQCWRLHMTCCSCIGVSSIPLCCSFVVKFWFFSYFVPSLFWQPIKTIAKLGSTMMRTLFNQCEARQQEVCICISNWFVFRKCTYPNSLHLYICTLFAWFGRVFTIGASWCHSSKTSVSWINSRFLSLGQ
jgi:hypothetical protein